MGGSRTCSCAAAVKRSLRAARAPRGRRGGRRGAGAGGRPSAAVGSAPAPAPAPRRDADDPPRDALFVNEIEVGGEAHDGAAGAGHLVDRPAPGDGDFSPEPSSAPGVGDVVLGRVLRKDSDGGAQVAILSAGFSGRDVGHARVTADVSAMAVGSVNRFEVMDVGGAAAGGRAPELRAATYRMMMQLHRAEQLLESGAYVDLEVRKVTKSSLVGELEGLTAFIPRAEVPRPKGEDDDGYFVGRVQRCLVSKVIRQHESVRCSVVAAHDKFRRSMKVGMLVHGVAVSVEPYGAFVKLDHSDVTVLLHVSKVSWARVRDVGEIVAAGDRVSGMVGEIETDGRLRVQILTNVLERERGEIVRRGNFAEVVGEAGERVREYRRRLVEEEGDLYYAQPFADGYKAAE